MKSETKIVAIIKFYLARCYFVFASDDNSLHVIGITCLDQMLLKLFLWWHKWIVGTFKILCGNYTDDGAPMKFIAVFDNEIISKFSQPIKDKYMYKESSDV